MKIMIPRWCNPGMALFLILCLFPTASLAQWEHITEAEPGTKITAVSGNTNMILTAHSNQSGSMIRRYSRETEQANAVLFTGNPVVEFSLLDSLFFAIEDKSDSRMYYSRDDGEYWSEEWSLSLKPGSKVLRNGSTRILFSSTGKGNISKLDRHLRHFDTLVDSIVGGGIGFIQFIDPLVFDEGVLFLFSLWGGGGGQGHASISGGRILWDTNNTSLKKADPLGVKHPERLAIHEDTLYCFTTTGSLYLSPDMGNTWIASDRETDGYIFLGKMGDTFVAARGDTDDALFLSKDGARSWERIPTPTPLPHESLYLIRRFGVHILDDAILLNTGEQVYLFSEGATNTIDSDYEPRSDVTKITHGPGFFTVALHDKSPSTVRLMTSAGRQIAISQGQKEHRIATKTLSHGVYFVRIESGNIHKNFQLRIP
ncbi:T9SS type A sorting domain-containing protein [Chitinivibrio alkaliphilus]|uniref:Secretion system C-terminal sorting domain-containing protein n=1 Tax=Chitinivibrio alkaliphilus ACht1 TaxID=1313304 RepID=U7DE45_9BACT|nr:T9SS type A sorting domain-containing protein [Chitinivibrio alkaliphilus]ERP39191.1 hypothetical protein CALK_0361 [Chitinivibrio alkaliphilus ACht1]